MSDNQLADFLAVIQGGGDLRQVAVEVDTVLEVAEVTRRVSREPQGGPALLFQRVKGAAFPVLTNLLGSERRLCQALRVGALEEVAERITKLIQPQVPPGLLSRLRLLPELAPLLNLPPRSVKSGSCQQIIRLGSDVDLSALPALECWPLEQRPLLAGAQVYTKHPETGGRNVGMYPAQVVSRNHLALNWHFAQGGWQHLQEYVRLGRVMPVALAFGGDPIFTVMAHAPLPPHTDECLLGGFLRQKSIDLVPCRTIDLEVPAEAELIIEGQIHPHEPLVEATPFGLSTGYYSVPAAVPLLEVTAITHRTHPILPLQVPGPSPLELDQLERAAEIIFRPLVQLWLPELVDYHFPRAGAHRNLLFVSIRKAYPGHAQQTMHALWGLGRMMHAKFIVVVDADVDVHNEEDVWHRVGCQVHPGRDVVFSKSPTHFHDHAAPVRGMGEKLGLDATRKFPDEGHPRPWPDPLRMPPAVEELVSQRWREYGI